LVVGGVLVGRQAVLCVVGQMRCEDDPVLEPERPDAERGEQQRVPPTSRHRDATSPRRTSATPRARATRRPSRTASWIVRGATASPARGWHPPDARQRLSSGRRKPASTKSAASIQLRALLYRFS